MKIATIIGARPQFIKAATVSRAIAKLVRSGQPMSSIKETIIHTGQHFDANMSEIFFRELDIPEPDYNLGIGGGNHGSNTGRMLEMIEAVLINEKPDWVMVYGDTDSTLAGALAAAKRHIPVAHVEAGLRSFNRIMPEEINRILADQLSTVLFCPTETAAQNLKNEGFPNKLAKGCWQQVHNVGDVMYDAALFYATKAEEKSHLIQELELKAKSFVLATVHRAENTDDPAILTGIMEALDEISKEIPVVLPLHPRTKKVLALADNLRKLCDSSSIVFIDPVGYLDMVMLEKNARVIMTDSGGVQKEAYFQCVPCVTLREETEWVELVGANANIIAGNTPEKIFQAYEKSKEINFIAKEFYGNGHSSEKILKLILSISV